MTKPNQSNQRGAIAILSLLGVTTFALAVVSTVAVLAIGELKQASAGGPFEQTYYAAEAGLNEGLYRLIDNPGGGSYSIIVNGVTVETAMTVNPDDHYQRIVRSQATSPSEKIKTVQIIANTDSFGVGFDYALQAAGRITMENGSTISGMEIEGEPTPGDVYSNDDIYFQSGASATITGDAYYKENIDSRILVAGSPCPNIHCHRDADPKALPMDDAAVQVLKDEIVAAGNPVLTANPSECSGSAPANSYCVDGAKTLGFQKIEGNFYLNNNAILTLTGNIWVTGKIIFNNNSTILVDLPVVEEDDPNDAFVIADDTVNMENNITICPGNPGETCPADAFVLIISTSASMSASAPAIYASNNSRSIVFAAINGMLRVKQNGALSAAAAQELYLEANSTVTYNPLLAIFSSPSGGGSESIGTALGTWEEL